MPYATIPLAWILISFVVGYLGRNRRMGFWGYFFATLFMTPFVGVILLIVSDKKKQSSDHIDNK